MEKTGFKLNIQKTKIMASSPITSWQIDGETMETLRDFIFLGSRISADGEYDKLKQHIKKQRHYFANKDASNQSCGFSSSHVSM